MSQRATFALGGGGSADSGSNGRNGGRFAYNGGNEVELDSYDDDPVMFRRGQQITETGGGGGADAWDSLPNGPGGRRVQMGLVHGEQSEQVRGQTGNPLFSWNLFGNVGGESDADMVRMMRLEPRTGPSARDGSPVEAFYLGEAQWESLIRQLMARVALSQPPTNPEAITIQAFSYPNKLVSPDGLMEMDIQNRDAANLTVYMRDTPDGPGTALWSARGGVTAAGRALGWR